MQASPGYPRDFFNRLLGMRSERCVGRLAECRIMKKLILRVYGNASPKPTVNLAVPLAFVGALSRLIPRRLTAHVGQHGASVSEVLSTIARDTPPGVILDVHDGGDRVFIAIEEHAIAALPPR